MSHKPLGICKNHIYYLDHWFDTIYSCIALISIYLHYSFANKIHFTWCWKTIVQLWLIYTRATPSCSAEIQDLFMFHINVITEPVCTKYLLLPQISSSADLIQMSYVLWTFIYDKIMSQWQHCALLPAFFFGKARLKPSLLRLYYFLLSRQLIKHHTCLG